MIRKSQDSTKNQWKVKEKNFQSRTEQNRQRKVAVILYQQTKILYKHLQGYIQSYTGNIENVNKLQCNRI